MSSTISTANVENVVNPPQNPIAPRSCTATRARGCCGSSASSTPRTSDPTTFTSSTGQGKRWLPEASTTNQRQLAPTAPPAAIAAPRSQVHLVRGTPPACRTGRSYSRICASAGYGMVGRAALGTGRNSQGVRLGRVPYVPFRDTRSRRSPRSGEPVTEPHTAARWRRAILASAAGLAITSRGCVVGGATERRRCLASPGVCGSGSARSARGRVSSTRRSSTPWNTVAHCAFWGTWPLAYVPMPRWSRAAPGGRYVRDDLAR